MTRRASVTAVRRLDRGHPVSDQDLVAVESPLAIAVGQAGRAWQDLGLLMRTPGDDRDLVLGFLHGEGAIDTPADVASLAVEAVTADEGDRADRVHVTLSADVDWRRVPAERPLPATSACGLCGRLAAHTLDRRRACRPGQPRLTAALIEAVPDRLRREQAVFDETGGLHAAAFFDAAGAPLAVREDVGRHNAVDKVVGAGLDAGWLPQSGLVLAVSGRVAYEIVQKAVMAGAAAIVAVGAPTSLAVEAARATGLTLVGFTRDRRFNVYAGWDRLDGPE